MNYLYTQRVCGEIDKITRCMTHNNTAPLKFGAPIPRESDACLPNLLSGVPDYFDRNKISSGGDLSHYSSASLY